MFSFILKYLKLVGLMGVALGVSYLLMGNVFLNNTPLVRPNAPSYIAQKLLGIPTRISNYVASLFRPNVKELLKDVAAVPVAKGIYAKQKDNMALTEINFSQIEWIQYQYIVNGKPIIVKYPKGLTPPAQAVVEQLYNVKQ
ncbi:hypothetical protein HGB07_02170 [Candidatus Roizmanbacteria bacterium]|nr:hypothetical protein [Candidatus Roizmanbacteria bacterium]